MGEDGGGVTFALDAYLVPRHGVEHIHDIGFGSPGGTMPKADKDKGGLFAEVNRRAGDTPGPEKYHKDILEKSFCQEMKGGKFSSVGRSWGKNKDSQPSVGTYQVDKALDTTKTRPKGGQITKGNRKCFLDACGSNGVPAPGKYDTKPLKDHLSSPKFSSPRTESRSPKKQAPLGPGYYNPNYEHLEKRVLVYSGSKDSAKSFLDKIMSSKEKTPAPGHVGIPESKVHDRGGKALHSARLMLDRHVVPRHRPIDSAHAPLSAR